MADRTAFEMQKPWSVEAGRCMNELANGGWDANGIYMEEAMHNWLNEPNEPMSRWINGLMNAWGKWTNEPMSQWINKSLNQRTNE